MFSSNAAQVSTAANYIEDVFSTYLYAGTSDTNSIGNNIQLGNGATTEGWIATLSGGNDFGRGGAVDALGNVYICGEQGSSAYLAKYNSLGVLQWQRALSITLVYGYAVTVDSSNNVYICGSTSTSSLESLYVAKYNSSGSIQWQRTLTNTQNTNGLSIAVDNSSNVYVCGFSLVSSASGLILVKYDTSGVLQWQRRLATAAVSVVGRSVAVDASGNVYVCGTGDVFGSAAIIIAKFNTSGSIQWQRYLDGASSDGGYGIGLDSLNNVYVTGDSNGFLILAKYNSSGTFQWQVELSNSSVGNSVIIDSSNNVYVISTLYAPTRMLILKYNSSGSLQWKRVLSTNNGSVIGNFISTDNSGSLYVFGSSSDISGTYDILLAKLPNDGTGVGAYTVGQIEFQYNESSVTSSSGVLSDGAGSFTASATGLLDAAGSLIDSAGTLVSNSTIISTGAGKGGMVWIKPRSQATDHSLYDTARGATFELASNLTTAQAAQSTGLTSFNNSGFSIGNLPKINSSGVIYTSWTFRKQAKFFDVVTYTGNGANRTIAHNLGSVPGCIMVKRTDAAGAWCVYHNSLTYANGTGAFGTTNAGQNILFLNTTNLVGATSTYWNDTDATSTTFSVGTNVDVNASGGTYVAYLYANNAGGFGSSGTDDVISCGFYVGDGTTNFSKTINLGWEPQFVLVKKTSQTADTIGWGIADNMRGFTQISNTNWLIANTTAAESILGGEYITLNSTGFRVGTSVWNSNTAGYIYIAIRRGLMKTPTSATSVFYPVTYTGTNLDNRLVNTNLITDMTFARIRTAVSTGGFYVADRLRNINSLGTSITNSENADSDSFMTPTAGYGTPFSAMNGFGVGNDITRQLNGSSTSQLAYAFRRAYGFFDEVLYSGTGVNLTVNHNLGVAPEFIISKARNAATDWGVYLKLIGDNSAQGLILNGSSGLGTYDPPITTADATTFQARASNFGVNGFTYVSYLFATVSGVSKIGSYTGTGTTQQINCGFTAGSRFVLIKRTDSAGDWYVWDSSRGIVAGNDPYLLLNSTAAEVTSTDYIDTYSAGFEISSTAPTAINANGGSFIFLAIA